MPRKRSPSKKEIEKIEKLFGIELKQENSIQNDRREEAMTAYLEQPKRFGKKKCKECDQIFAVNRRNVSFCGSKCRLSYLKRHFGLVKHVNEPNGDDDHKWVWQVWFGNEPLILPEVDLKIAEAIIQSSEKVNGTVEGTLDDTISFLNSLES